MPLSCKDNCPASGGQECEKQETRWTALHEWKFSNHKHNQLWLLARLPHISSTCWMLPHSTKSKLKFGSRFCQSQRRSLVRVMVPFMVRVKFQWDKTLSFFRSIQFQRCAFSHSQCQSQQRKPKGPRFDNIPSQSCVDANALANVSVNQCACHGWCLGILRTLWGRHQSCWLVAGCFGTGISI